ncbi:MAG: zinc ribbon domain-containing protein [Christensenellaceae bacterium]|jgi:hypothetical protein|nr:zinc ribbon domain-containing protein [Christensenellaceae bacterium]
MKCEKCGSEVNADNKFCMYCGAPNSQHQENYVPNVEQQYTNVEQQYPNVEQQYTNVQQQQYTNVEQQNNQYNPQQPPSNDMSQVFGGEYYAPGGNQYNPQNQLWNNYQNPQIPDPVTARVLKTNKQLRSSAIAALICSIITLIFHFHLLRIITLVFSTMQIGILIRQIKRAPAKLYKTCIVLHIVSIIIVVIAFVVFPTYYISE